MRAALSRVIGWSAWPILIVVLCLTLLAPVLEGALFPIRTDQRIENVTRTADRLCWDWVSIKNRNRVSDDMNVEVQSRTDRFVTAIFERDTGMPWARSRAVGIGFHRQPYCILLPPSLDQDEPIRITQTAYYPGWLPLWHVPVHLPDVISVP